MAKFVYGERIGRDSPLKVGCSAVIFDATRQKVLLTRRSDNALWCLPGGGMEAGESSAEACIREVWEETGLQVQVERLIGLYSTPHRITMYADGNHFQFVSLCFEATVISGELGLSDETTAVDYFSLAELQQLAMTEPHIERIVDALANQAAAFVR